MSSLSAEDPVLQQIGVQVRTSLHVIFTIYKNKRAILSFALAFYLSFYLSFLIQIHLLISRNHPCPHLLHPFSAPTSFSSLLPARSITRIAQATTNTHLTKNNDFPAGC